MRKLYHLLEKLATVSQQLSYGHYIELLPYNDINKIQYYIKLVEKENLSIRKIRQRIKSNEYERLDKKTRNKLINKERHKVITYFEIGKLLNEAGGKYGDKIIEEYVNKLMVEVGKKYNRRTLFRMKQFYNVFSNEKVSTLWTQLKWSHLRLLKIMQID